MLSTSRFFCSDYLYRLTGWKIPVISPDLWEELLSASSWQCWRPLLAMWATFLPNRTQTGCSSLQHRASPTSHHATACLWRTCLGNLWDSAIVYHMPHVKCWRYFHLLQETWFHSQSQKEKRVGSLLSDQSMRRTKVIQNCPQAPSQTLMFACDRHLFVVAYGFAFVALQLGCTGLCLPATHLHSHQHLQERTPARRVRCDFLSWP